MQYRDRRHVVRDRIVDAEVKKLELRGAHAVTAQAREATEPRLPQRPTPWRVNPPA